MFDALIIGAGLSGLTAASLLAKKGFKVGVIDRSYNPGGSCGVFKRNGITFDQGSAMMYGFGEQGFNPHRFIMNCLEEPIDIIHHDHLYCVNYQGHRIIFCQDIDRFVEQLGELFPTEKDNLKRYYHDMYTLYKQVFIEFPAYSSPDENDLDNSLKGIKKHPLAYLKFLSYLNKSTDRVLRQYFKDPEIFKFFNKLTSTYSYTSVKETPAIMSSIMFIDNHIGGSYYPAGGSYMLVEKLVKVIEENGGTMILEKEVSEILFEDNQVVGARLTTGEQIKAKNTIYSGTVWNLYGKLIKEPIITKSLIEKTKKLIPTYPSVVLYAYVDEKVIPKDTLPVEMLIGNPDSLDESEVTVYTMSIDDKTLCPESGHVVMAIGPSFATWDRNDKKSYLVQKEKEKIRLLNVLEKRFPGFTKALILSDLATPLTIERYCLKNNGAVAGPKQSIGQHMFKRLHIRSPWPHLFYCGESTAMGTGTPAVSISGLSAANAILKQAGLPLYKFDPKRKNVVRTVDHPFELKDLYASETPENKVRFMEASRCQFCEHPTCSRNIDLDIRGIMRRLSAGNIVGATKIAEDLFTRENEPDELLERAQHHCVLKSRGQDPVSIIDLVYSLHHSADACDTMTSDKGA
jgi:prolycopene isomerase